MLEATNGVTFKSPGLLNLELIMLPLVAQIRCAYFFAFATFSRLLNAEFCHFDKPQISRHMSSLRKSQKGRQESSLYEGQIGRQVMCFTFLHGDAVGIFLTG